ncbi:ATP-binding protein [Streptomyces niveiscabiei]|uniref:ATP-binding protein n=1 Tax=Streptomyces niveiscabiei TaxID=164115 RepID=A0ABW9I617_9ACTN
MSKLPPLSAEWSVLADQSHVGVIRRQAASRVVEWGLTDLADPVRLLVSELLTNAIKAMDATAGEPVTTRLSYDGHALEISVSDASAERPHLTVPDLQREGGRGLLIVEALSKDWGYRPDATGKGKTVWCVVAVPEPDATAAPTKHNTARLSTNSLSGLSRSAGALFHKYVVVSTAPSSA